MTLSFLLVTVFFPSQIATGAWKNSIEEWTAEDWNEDVSVPCWIDQLIIHPFQSFYVAFKN